MWCRTIGVIVMLILSLLATPLVVHAQSAGKMPRLVGTPSGTTMRSRPMGWARANWGRWQEALEACERSSG